MALYKFSKTKTFHVEYCGCTAASNLLDETSIRLALKLIRDAKSKHEFVKTTLSISKDGVNIIYENDQKFSTKVPAANIAGSSIGKSTFNDTFGIVYISPLNGRHYPAFVHAYRCDSARTAQKLLARFKNYFLNDTQRFRLIQLEQKLVNENKLNTDLYRPVKLEQPSPNTTIDSTKTNTVYSSSSGSSGSLLNKSDAIRSITNELKTKIDSKEPILFPPKDYDQEPNIQRAQKTKTTQSTVVAHQSTSNENHTQDIDFDDDILPAHTKRRYSTPNSDITVDPLETVSLAFNFLKDEVGSVITDNDANSECVDADELAEPPVFRPKPIPIPRKTEYPRTKTNDIPHSFHQSYSTSRDDLNNYYDRTHYRSQQMSVGYLASSETDLRYDSQPVLSRSARDSNWPFNGNGAPISNNPLWTPPVLGSQPNLLSPTSSNVYDGHRSHLSSQFTRPMVSVPSHQSYYPNYSNNKPSKVLIQKENMQRRPGPPPPPPSNQSANLQKKRSTTLPYPDMQGFILRPSDGPIVKNQPYNQRFVPNAARDYRPQSINVNGNNNSMLDVYY